MLSLLEEAFLLILFFFSSQNYTDYVGSKSTFRLLNRGSAKALDKVVELDGNKLVTFVYYSDGIILQATN